MEETPKVFTPKSPGKPVDNSGYESNEPATLSAEPSIHDSNIGKKIAENMDEFGYHPVVIFGSSNSGKSSLLGSLLAYFQVDTTMEVGISLGDPIIPAESEHGTVAMQLAQTFYYRSVQEFIGGEAHPSTKLAFPIFIPVIIRPKGKPEIKFAFMESAGEWYKPNKESDRFFQELKSEIEGVLRHYQKGISFIHVAPFTQSSIRNGDVSQEVERTEIRDASLALVGALDSYTKLRTFKESDSHMFLVTKWDAYTERDKELFDILANPDASEVEAFANDKYTQGFAAFKGLPLDNGQKAILQYCSGLISGRDIIKPTKELTPILHRYPQTMWNWLYKNATNGSILIPKPIPVRENAWQIVMKWINKVIS